MAVLDNVTNGGVLATTNPWTWTHGGTASITKGYVVVFIGVRANDANHTATYDGAPMTLLATASSGSATVAMAFGIATTVGNGAVSVTNAGASAMTGGSVSLTDAQQSPSFGLGLRMNKVAQSQTTSTVNVDVIPESLVLSCYMMQADRTTINYVDTKAYQQNGALPSTHMFAIGYGTTENSAWTWDGSAQFGCHIALVIGQNGKSFNSSNINPFPFSPGIVR